MRPARAIAATASALAVAVSLALGAVACAPEPTPAAEEPSTPSTKAETPAPPVPEPADPTTDADPAGPGSASDARSDALPQHSIDDPSSLWVVTNKHRPLDPLDYEPSDLVMPEGIENVNGQPLRAEAAAAATRMAQAASADGVWFRIGSAYRDYAKQEYLYTSYIARDGQTEADTYSARPGFSEHQTGLTADFDDASSCYLWACFADTAAGAWLAEHAAEHGWILRYPAGSEHVTGYTFEPWHFRYVGEPLALEMRERGVATLEEYFELAAAPTYLDE